jgi:molybdopterin molybdotransferase
MINDRKARSIILDAVLPLEPLTAAVERSSGGVAFEPVIAGEHIPPFDNSGMDGYAVRTEDTAAVPVVLRVVGKIPAGSVSSKKLQQGETMRIMTGAQVPEGCDAVVQQEWTEREGDNVRIMRTVSPGHNIRLTGADISKGSTVLSKGQKIRPQDIGLLASLGIQFIVVYRKPVVALLSTGNELIDIDKPLTTGKIRNSNAYVLGALLSELGCTVKQLGIANDSPEDIKSKVIEGLQYDLLITSGGVSVGEYDYVPGVFNDLGVTIHFSKVNIKPGMPLVFGDHKGKPVFGLPGNPVSAMVTFLQFVKPALMKMMGHSNVEPAVSLQAVLTHELRKTDGKRHYTRGIVERSNGALVVRTTGAQTSNILFSLSQANCLIILPEDQEVFREGESVEVQLL